jgi:serine/threonine protein kinase
MKNILVECDKDEPEVYIIDFGSSSSFKRWTNAGYTTNYAAPELLTWAIHGGPETDLIKFLGVDVYSLGTMLFELFSNCEYAEILDSSIKENGKARKDKFA